MKKWLVGLLLVGLLAGTVFAGMAVDRFKIHKVTITSASTATSLTLTSWDAYGIQIRSLNEIISFSHTSDGSAVYTLNTNEVFSSPSGNSYLPINYVIYFLSKGAVPATAEAIYWTK